MNVYEIGSLSEKLANNTYPGRGIVLGVSPDGENAVAAYFIMGRSVNSRNRIFALEPDGIRTEANDPSLMKDPHLIIYHPVRQAGCGLIVTNGDQTDTIWEFLAKGESWEAALRTRMFEDDGIELSGGQWQKLSVSRAFYKKSDILILDEPTASLDAMAEQEIFNQFRELSRGKITIFVSHRLSSAVDADKIVVLEHGRVVELGNHEELMHLGGKYHMLFTTQASRYQSQMN